MHNELQRDDTNKWERLINVERREGCEQILFDDKETRKLWLKVQFLVLWHVGRALEELCDEKSFAAWTLLMQNIEIWKNVASFQNKKGWFWREVVSNKRQWKNENRNLDKFS